MHARCLGPPRANGGWLHVLAGDRAPARRRRPRGVRTVYVPSRVPGRADLAELSRSYRVAAAAHRIEELAASLGVTAESLSRLGVGWAFDDGRPGVYDAGDVLRCCGGRTWAFPMTDGKGAVLGIRLRAEGGRKWAVAGGREGLFIPAGLGRPRRLLIAEGPTDCAALLDLAFAAVGRPSCTGGVSLLVELVRRLKPEEVVIVADADAPGRRGAEALARVLRVYAQGVKAITPPDGVKDARAWKAAGATSADLEAAIAAAPALRLAVRGRVAGRTSRNGSVRKGVR